MWPSGGLTKTPRYCFFCCATVGVAGAKMMENLFQIDLGILVTSLGASSHSPPIPISGIPRQPRPNRCRFVQRPSFCAICCRPLEPGPQSTPACPSSRGDTRRSSRGAGSRCVCVGVCEGVVCFSACWRVVLNRVGWMFSRRVKVFFVRVPLPPPPVRQMRQGEALEGATSKWKV